MTNESHAEIVTTSMRQDETYISVYITWMYLVFMYTLPFGGLSVLNVLMYLDVRCDRKRLHVQLIHASLSSNNSLLAQRLSRRTNRRNVTLSSSQRKEMKLAVMLMIVSLLKLKLAMKA